MLWKPINLTESCPPNAQFAACSYFGFVYLNLLVQLYGDSADRRIQNREYEGIEESLHEYDQDEDSTPYGISSEDEEYDFIVVGAGPAGCVVASRLTEHAFSVLLLEAGPEQPDVTRVPAFATGLTGSNIIWTFYTQPDGKSCLAYKDQRCLWPTGRTMGGGSSVNALVYARGNKLDYDTWAAMGNDGWSYRDVLPFFKKSENNLNQKLNRKYHGLDGEQIVSKYPYVDIPSIMMTEAYVQSGLPLHDCNCEEQVGTMQAQVFALDGQRMSANNAFIQPIRYKRKNLTVRVESLVVEILINDQNKAYGVRYIKDGKSFIATAKKEVIVSAGAINSPKLLMLSGIGPKDHLIDVGLKVVKDLPVGYNLHEHVSFYGTLIVLPNDTATMVSNDEILNAIIEHKKTDIKDGPLFSNGPVSSISFMKTDPNLPAPDIQFQADVVQSWRDYVKEPALYKSITIFPNAFYDGILPRTVHQLPASRGRIYLNKTDKYAHPLIFANYFDKPEDLKTVIKGAQFLLTLGNTKAFRERGAYFYNQSLPPCEGYTWGTEDYIACMAMSHTTTAYHPVGTCKMGPKWDTEAVVDPKLRVYGIEGLRVIDSSIMPVTPRGNTNAPTLMLAERGVDFILKYWLGKSRFCV